MSADPIYARFKIFEMIYSILVSPGSQSFRVCQVRMCIGDQDDPDIRQGLACIGIDHQPAQHARGRIIEWEQEEMDLN